MKKVRRKYNKKPKRRPKKKPLEKQRRIRTQKKRLASMGVSEEELKQMTPVDVRQRLKVLAKKKTSRSK